VVSTPRRVDLTEPLITPQEAARLLQVKLSTIYEWVRVGRLPCIRLGPRAIRFTKSLLEEWAAGQIDGGRQS
jgi:excisionase family DNA binding protein